MLQITKDLCISESESKSLSPKSTATKQSRLQYVRFAGNAFQYVYYDVHEDGAETFEWEEPGDVRSFAFEPSPDELDAARALRLAVRGGCGWAEYIDVDLPNNAFDRAHCMSLREFRGFIHRTCGRNLAITIDRIIAKCLQEAMTGEIRR
jgi:hypothetical protein